MESSCLGIATLRLLYWTGWLSTGGVWLSASGVTPEQQGGDLDDAYDLILAYYTCSLRKELVEGCRSYNASLNFH